MITLQEFYLYAKVIGATGSAITAFYGAYKYFSAVYKQRKSIDETVTLLATNHLPHIQKSLDEHGRMFEAQNRVLQTITSDVRNVGTKVDGIESRLEDTKKGVHTLGESFLRHIESVTKEPPRKRRK